MTKTVVIRLTCAGNRTGPFDISDNYGDVLGVGITKQNLIDGYTVSVDDAVTMIILESTGKCKTIIEMSIVDLTIEQIAAITFTPCNTASVWRHLTNITIYNKFLII